MVRFAVEIGAPIDRTVVLAERLGDEFDANPNAVGEGCGANKTDDS
jgi:hypothetical protein